MAIPRANYPIITWPVRLDAPLYVQIQQGLFARDYTIPAGLYDVFVPSSDTPLGTYGLAYDSGASFSNLSLPAVLGGLLKAWWDDYAASVPIADDALVRVAYDAYEPTEWGFLPSGTSITPTDWGTYLAPAAGAYVLEPELVPSVTSPILIRFSSDPANFLAPSPDVANVDNDIMGPGGMGAGFWGMFGYGQVGSVIGGPRTRTLTLRWDAASGVFATYYGPSTPSTAIQSPVPFRGTWCPDQDVVDDAREAIASAGVSANPYSVQAGRVTTYGPQRYRVALVLPYVVCNRVQRHRLFDSAFDSLLEFGKRPVLVPDNQFLREQIQTWEDAHRAVLDNLPLAIVWQPIHPTPSGLRGRLRGRMLDTTALSNWSSTFDNSTDNGQYIRVLVAMEVEDV